MLLFMHLGSLLLLALVFVIVWAIRAINTRLACKRASCHQKRGHLPWDIFGISKIIEIVRAVLDGSILFYMETLWNLYGDTYTVNVMGKKITFTSNAANIRQILQNQFKDYDAAKGIRISMFEHVAPGTIAATDGREWKDNRSKWRHYVAHLDQVLNLDFVEGEFKSLIRRVTEGAPVDMQPLFLDFTTDIIHAMTLGESTNCINPEKQSLESKNYVASLIRSNSTTAMRGLLGPVARFIFQGGYKKDCTAVKEYLGHRIQNRLAAEEQGEGQAPRQETFLDRLLRFTHDPVTLNHNVTSMIMASEPISGPLSHTIWLLSRDSAVYEKLRKSVLELVGYQRPTYEQFTKFTYLKNVINESLRLLPPEPLTLRIANTDTCLPSDGERDRQQTLVVQKGQRVVISIFGCHRNSGNFGKDASNFRPERWETEKTKKPGYIPFSIGPRTCSGQQLALNLATYTLVRLVQTYSHIETHDSSEFAATFHFSLYNRNGVWVKMIPDPQAAQDFA